MPPSTGAASSKQTSASTANQSSRRDEPSPDVSKEKRFRNRESQRLFRERRNRHFKELEERIKCLTMSADDRHARLIAENTALRASLAKAQKHFLRLGAVINELSDDFGKSLDQPADPPQNGRSPSTADSSDGNQDKTNQQEASTECYDLIVRDENDFEVADIDAAIHSASSHHADWDGSSISLPNSHYVDLDINSISAAPILEVEEIARTTGPDVDLFEIHCQDLNMPVFCTNGFELPISETFGSSLLVPFASSESSLLRALYTLLNHWFTDPHKANLSFSEHIEGMETLLKDYMKLVGEANKKSALAKGCLMAMLLFTRYTRSMPPSMWFSSYCYSLIERVLVWRLDQTFDTLSSLPAIYQPSELQMATPHSSIIDWFGYSPLRDQLILYFNRSPILDQIFVDQLDHSVIEVDDISTILTGVEKGPGFLGVWNIFSAMSNTSPNQQSRPVCRQEALEMHDDSLSGLLQVYKLPLPDCFLSRESCPTLGFWEPVSLFELLSSRYLATRLYHCLGLYSAHKSWRIDPAFYETYSQLKWAGYENTIARGNSYRVATNWKAAF